jgi:tryptophan-rich sensory protein
MNFLLSFFVQIFIFGLALFVGNQFTGTGLNSDWYKNLILPPWQPPGWVFGVAWSSILFTFSAAMAIIIPYNKIFSFENNFISLFWAQIILNVIWNVLFFKFQLSLFSFIEILALLILVVLITIRSFNFSILSGILCLPYAVWLVIACSLNGFIWLKN